MASRRRSTAVLVVLVLLVSACTRTEPAARSVATSTPAPTPTPEPTPEPTVVVTDTRVTIDALVDAPFPLNIAHAGGDQTAPHSTMFAYTEAVDIGATVLEVDVQLTADGVLIVHHDDTVDRTTEASGPVGDLTLAEIQALDNAYWFSPECWPCQDRPEEEYIYRGVRTGETPPPDGYGPEDFRVVTFAELVERFPDHPFDIEIKGGFPDGFATAVELAEQIELLEITDNVVVVSFDDAVLRTFETIAPEVETSPGTDELTNWFLLDQPLEGDHRIVQVPPEFSGIPVLTDDFWAKAERDGLEVWVWPNDAATQENQAFYQQLIAQGADGVIAGRPNEMAAATL